MTSCKSGKHLFILSGQSNMARLDPSISFTPTIEDKYGKDNVIIIKNALGGQPMRRWYRDWKSPVKDKFKAQADLYDSLMAQVNPAIEKAKLKTITFIWMQGERDAREALGDVYEESLLGLYDQLSRDLGRKDVNFIIGRLSDNGMDNDTFPHWTKIRDIQVRVGESNPRFGWIDTDDLNDGMRGDTEIHNDLHMADEGYRIMGERFAKKAIELIEKND